jgi:pilus assembly protein CpaB
MSLRLVVIGLILTTAAALGLIAYQVATPPQVAQKAAQASVPAPFNVLFLVAAHGLPAGTLLRDEDFMAKPIEAAKLPAGAITEAPEARSSLRGALLARYLESGTPVTSADVIRSHDRGFLASVLAPGTRAVTIGVDQVTGVAGLIWPGDSVDVILTQQFDQSQTSIAKRVLSETVLTGVRVIAVDQDIVQGGAVGSTLAGRATKTVTLQVTTDQAERLTVAQRLGQLALAVRAIGDAPPADPAAVYGGDVSPALGSSIPLPGSRIQVIQGDNRSEVNFK